MLLHTFAVVLAFVCILQCLDTLGVGQESLFRKDYGAMGNTIVR